MRSALLTAVTAAIIIGACSCSTISKSEMERKTRIERSPNFKRGSFVNEHVKPMKFNAATILKFLFVKEEREPSCKLPVKPVDLKWFTDSNSNQLNSTWLGHSSLMVNIDGYRIMLDPVFESRVSFFGPARYNGKTPLDLRSLPDIDVVIVSHNHYDHLNKYSLKLLKDKAKRFIVPLGVGSELEDCGIAPEKIHEMDWWEELPLDSNLTIAATPAQHFSGRSLTDRNAALWASWVIRSRHHRIFFSGDGGYSDGFSRIGEKYGPFDMTFMECGAYNEDWHHIHMYPEETVQAHLDLRGKILHPIHCGTFNLAFHSWYDPFVRVAAKADTLNVSLALPVVGETVVFGSQTPAPRWWEPYINKK